MAQILIVDDSSTVRDEVTTFLRMQDWTSSAPSMVKTAWSS